MRVAARQLPQRYRTLDQLHARKDATAQALFLTLRDLFSLPVDMVFYDLTSTYFEGEGPPDLGAHGHSRHGRPIAITSLLATGAMPRRSPTCCTISKRASASKRVVFVGDRGMVTSQNLDDQRGGGHGYIVGRDRRRSREVFDDM